MHIEIPMECSWVFIMYSSSSTKVDRKIYKKLIVRENDKRCKFKYQARRAIFNQKICKFYDIDNTHPPKKLFFKVNADKYFYTHATWKNHFIILVDKKEGKEHFLQFTPADLVERVLFYFQSIYFKNARHIKNVTPHNFTLTSA
jgi:hypothetical protein